MASSAFRVSQSRAFCPRAPLIPTSLTDPVRFTFPCRQRRGASERLPLRAIVVTATEKPNKRQASRDCAFVDEIRVVAMKLHTRDQAAKEGEKEPEGPPLFKWEPTIEGYLRFLVDSKIVYGTLETIIRNAAYPWYAEFKNTGLERSDKLAKDLEWFKGQGHTIPEPSPPGDSYAQYLEELSKKDPQAFICHFYNVYFAHTAGGRMIGSKVAEKILDNKELEFYKWHGNLSELLQNNWSREEKDHCLEENEKSFKYSGDILRLILS
ncbi:heme oxygenase 1, chloroplastic-like isoform X2 [Curcuma longa]|uniref:heme oxygenase 1, chloroplastic-like isoform X2 n=1 Tax=Curcuma longa TaxID=136217 RepID=UPI003D9F2CF3